VARNITSINAVITLTIPGLYSSPQQLQQFSATNIFDVGTQDLNETAMGLDGYLSAGTINAPIDQTITLMADSLSNDLFRNWALAIKQQQDPLRCSGFCTLKGIGVSYGLVNGVLVSWPPIPTAGRTLEAQRYLIRWQSLTVNPIPGT